MAQIDEIEDREKILCMELNEEYDDWYNSDEEEFYYEDPDGIADTIGKSCEFIHICVDREGYREAAQLGKRLFALEVYADGDYGEDELSLKDLEYHQLISIDVKKVMMDVIYSIYLSEEGQKRAESIYQVICNARLREFRIENLMQYAKEELPEFNQFLSQWTMYLGNESGDMADHLMAEAIELNNDIEAAWENAKRYVKVHPELFLKILENGKAQESQKMIQIGCDGVNRIDKSYRVRGEVALKTAEYLNQEGDKKLAEKCYLAAFESDTNAVNYLRVLLNCTDEDHIRKLKKMIENLPKKAKSYTFNTPETGKNSPTNNMCSSLRFLNGQFMEEVRNSMNVKEALGWSGTFMKEGLALYSLLLYEGSGFAKGIKKMQQDSMVALQFTRDVRKAHSFRCGMDSTNNVYVNIENIHIL